MRTVPKNTVPKIQFFETRLPKWAENASEIGTDLAAVETLEALTQAAREAYREQQAAQDAAKAATDRLKQAVAAMGNAGAAIIGQVRAKACSAGETIYPLALLPVPTTPSAIAPPGKPTQFKIELSDIGELTFTWKCKNPPGASGTMYHVWRKIGAGEFVYRGTTGEKKFLDNTVPPGTATMIYQVQAVRSKSSGPVARYTVNFGTTRGAPAMAAANLNAAKLAA